MRIIDKLSIMKLECLNYSHAKDNTSLFVIMTSCNTEICENVVIEENDSSQTAKCTA